MKASFDDEAKKYDYNFTESLIGKAQRNMVHYHIKKHLTKTLNILEINCGTGVDAIWLAEQKHNIIATDISEKMILEASCKTELKNLTFLQLDLLKVHDKFKGDNFDFMFSNFGGLNCLTKSDLKYFFQNISSILHSKSKIALVIMPKNTIWEQVYFILKQRTQEAFRRKKESVIVNVSNELITTYYYNPKDIVNLSKSNFTCIECKPIGFFVPPSYLEPFVKRHQIVFRILRKLDVVIKSFSFLSKYADHYLIVLEKK